MNIRKPERPIIIDTDITNSLFISLVLWTVSYEKLQNPDFRKAN